ncbi:MAG: TetR/AcrR family transcriptional regulator [Acidimicrobiales bacterium]
MPRSGAAPAAARNVYDVDALVDVAVKVFLQRGYDGTSIGDVASAAGLGKSSIYHHVVSKEELLRRGLERAFVALFGVLDEPPALEGRPSERLRHVLRRTVEVTTAALPEVALLLRVRGNTGTERWALGRRREFDRAVTGLVHAAIFAEEVRGDLDAALVTRLVFGMSNSITEWYKPGSGHGAGQIADVIDRIVFQGIARRR